MKSKTKYDKKAIPQTIQIKDKVYLRDESSHKLENVLKGPYEVTEINKSRNFKIKIGNKFAIVHKNRLKLP